MIIDLQKLAKLARLYVSPEEEGQLEEHLGAILDMVENLPDIDTESLLDIEHIMTLRSDVIEPSMDRASLLASAPESAAGCVLVPKTVEQ